MKLIIQFNSGQYSPVKNEFKGLFSKVFKWDGYKAWKGKSGFVEATEKMEPGMPHTFNVECDENIGKKLKDFCDNEIHKISYTEVQEFITFKVPSLLPEDEIPIKYITTKEENKTILEYPWMCSEYNYDLWTYRKAQILNSPDFKVDWK